MGRPKEERGVKQSNEAFFSLPFGIRPILSYLYKLRSIKNPYRKIVG